MHDRVSRLAADLLAHKAGFVAFNVFTVVWFGAAFTLPLELGDKVAAALLLALAGYLDIVTWFSSATQFTLAYEARKAREAAERTDAQQAQMMQNQLHLMQFILDGQAKIQAEIEDMEERLRRLER